MDGKNDSAGDSEIIRATLHHLAGGLGCPCPGPQGWGHCRDLWGKGFHPEPRRQGCHGGDTSALVGPGGGSASHRRLAPALKSNGFCLASFWTFRDPSPHSYLQCLPFRMGLSVTCLSHHCILDAHTCLVSQIHCWRRIFPQDKSYNKSHPYWI